MIQQTPRLKSLLIALCLLLAIPATAGAAAPEPPPLKPAVAKKVAEMDANVMKMLTSGKYRLFRERKAVLKLLERAWGKDSPHLAQRVVDYASALTGEMDYLGALKQYKRAANLFEKLHGPKHEMTAMSLQMAGVMSFVLGNSAQGDALMEQSMAIREQLYGAESQMYAAYLQIWGSLLVNAHAYDRAELVYRRSLSVLAKLKGPDDVSLSGILTSLGWLFYMKGDYTNGDKYYLRSVEIGRKTGTANATSVASQWLVVAEVNHGLGRLKTAQKFYDRARQAIDEELAHLTNKFGASSSQVRKLMMSKAKLLLTSGKKDDALELLKQLKSTQASTHESGFIDFQLGVLALHSGNVRAARAAFQSLVNYYKTLGGGGMTAGPLTMLAQTHRVAGEYRKAMKLVDRVERQYTSAFGANHPITLRSKESRATLYAMMGNPQKAIAELKRMHDKLEPYTDSVLAGGTEGDNRQYLARVAYQLDTMLTMHRQFAPGDQSAARLAMRLILQRKGRILDAVADVYGGMRRRMNAADQELLDALRAARTRLSRLVLRGQGKDAPAEYQKQLSRAETAVRRMEEKIRKRSAAFRAATSAAGLPEVTKSVPKGALLVEFVAYERLDFKASNLMSNAAPAHYAAYILDQTGTIRTVDLGLAAPIDKLIGEFRKALADPNRDDVKRLAQKVYQGVFKPLESVVGSTRRLILSPDGAINLIPFAALVDERGSYLIKRFIFSYISSGRDLVRFKVASKARSGPAIVANPNFDGVAPTKQPSVAAANVLPPVTRGRVARALRNAKWKQLPGTGVEAAAVAKVLPKAVVKTGAQATEAALKALKGPKILHIATHGFFLPNERKLQLPGSELGGLVPASDATMTSIGQAARRAMGGQTTAENPLLRSGLALGGANQLISGNDDGVLTALEASDLDLWGTELVVLSACETGVGEVRAGDGVHGLRRALTIAGAQSLVMSLWQVDDEATKDLMIGYYQALENGKGRADGLRQMQLKMLQDEAMEHPFFWAAFIPAGRWQPLSR